MSNLNDLMDDLREAEDKGEPIMEAMAKYTLRSSGMPERDGVFPPEAREFWTKVARMVGRTDKPKFYLSAGEPLILMGFKLPKDSKTGLAMEGSFMVKIGHGDNVYTQASVWFPELPTAGVGVTAKPWKGFVAPADESYPKNKDISGGELVKAFQRQRAEARAHAIKRASEGNWGQYKEDIGTGGLGELLDGLREAAGDDLGHDPASKAPKVPVGHTRALGARESGYSEYSDARTLKRKEGLSEGKLPSPPPLPSFYKPGMKVEYKLALANKIRGGRAVGNLCGIYRYIDGRGNTWALQPQENREEVERILKAWQSKSVGESVDLLGEGLNAPGKLSRSRLSGLVNRAWDWNFFQDLNDRYYFDGQAINLEQDWKDLTATQVKQIAQVFGVKNPHRSKRVVVRQVLEAIRDMKKAGKKKAPMIMAAEDRDTSDSLSEAKKLGDLLSVLKKGKQSSAWELGLAFGAEPQAVAKELDSLTKQGKVKRRGSGDKATYSLGEMVGDLGEGLTGPTRMQIQNSFDKHRKTGLSVRQATMKVEKEFRIKNVQVNSQGDVVHYTH